MTCKSTLTFFSLSAILFHPVVFTLIVIAVLVLRYLVLVLRLVVLVLALGDMVLITSLLTTQPSDFWSKAHKPYKDRAA